MNNPTNIDLAKYNRMNGLVKIKSLAEFQEAVKRTANTMLGPHGPTMTVTHIWRDVLYGLNWAGPNYDRFSKPAYDMADDLEAEGFSENDVKDYLKQVVISVVKEQL